MTSVRIWKALNPMSHEGSSECSECFAAIRRDNAHITHLQHAHRSHCGCTTRSVMCERGYITSHHTCNAAPCWGAADKWALLRKEIDSLYTAQLQGEKDGSIEVSTKERCSTEGAALTEAERHCTRRRVNMVSWNRNKIYGFNNATALVTVSS